MRKTKLPKFIECDIVTVVWEDPTSCDSWHSMNEPDSEPHKIHSCGYLIYEAEDYICIALNIDTDSENCSQSITIPRKLIYAVHTVKFK